MNRRTLAIALVAFTAAFAGTAAQAEGQAGGYDYAAKFYPHPAWLYLRAEAPSQNGEHPAVIVARQARAQQAETVAQASQKFYPHPAWMYLSAEAPRVMNEHPAVIVARRAAEAQDAAVVETMIASLERR